MKSTRIDLTGMKFARLTVTQYSHTEGKKAFWHCVCDCGRAITLYGAVLRSGNTRSCGCLQRDIVRARSIGNSFGGKHGHTKNLTCSRTYRSWKSMIQRCTNPNVPRFNRWGGRGIKVCDRWADFENFLADMGERPVGMSLDRINNDGNYEPGNCRWATPTEQRMNQGPREPRKRRSPASTG